jgi:hypothetical protein
VPLATASDPFSRPVIGLASLLLDGLRDGEAILYKEDFDGEPATGWSLGEGWQFTTDDDGNGVLHGQGHEWATYKMSAGATLHFAHG